ncbi:Fur family transcriptional regulator [Streptomyces sp. HUAS TT11]|uniref:Fur family transcriptional regulator n=1 Tax=Streptomyces sp. HUAS TT11 TaxID=3447508 RepID=UPI003F65C973
MHLSPTSERPPGRRSTWQRAAVLRTLRDRPGFISAKELHAALASRGTTVGLSTVYRTLQALERAGRLDVVRDRTGERLYRPRPVDGHRHYLVCRLCGLSLPVAAETVERWADGVAATTGFADVEHIVELTGICFQCRAKPDSTSSPAGRSTNGNDFH